MATNSVDRQKHKENLQKTFKKFHKFRNSQINDYKFVEKLIKNIIQGGNYMMYGKMGKKPAKKNDGNEEKDGQRCYT